MIASRRSWISIYQMQRKRLKNQNKLKSNKRPAKKLKNKLLKKESRKLIRVLCRSIKNLTSSHKNHRHKLSTSTIMK